MAKLVRSISHVCVLNVFQQHSYANLRKSIETTIQLATHHNKYLNIVSKWVEF